MCPEKNLTLPPRTSQVRQSSLVQVAGESHIRINNKSVPAKDRKLKPFEPRKITANAKKCLGKTVAYDMFRNNAEHYVTMWRYGKAWSDQVISVLSIACPRVT